MVAPSYDVTPRHRKHTHPRINTFFRMFSHPWTTTAKEADPAGGHGSGVSSALRRVGLLNDKLKERSLRLLRARGGGKGKARREGGEGDDFGSCEFNVALINRMEPSDDRPDLKLEPTFGQDRCVWTEAGPVFLPSGAVFFVRICIGGCW